MNTIQLSELKVLSSIGEGCFGKVWKANYLGTPVAVKECEPTEDSAEFDFVTYFNREAEMLSKARHPNIVQFLGTCVQDEKFYIVTEYIGSGTMKSWLVDGKARKLSIRISFAIDIARALTFLHNCQIIHRDLKPSNLLITENCRVKVCDFGFARLAAQTEEEMRRMSYCGTDEYMAPEIMMGQPFDESVDVFGFGIILCELISCQVATSHTFKRQVPGFGIDPQEVWNRATYDCPSQLIELALRCLNVNPRVRPRMEWVMETLHQLELQIWGSQDQVNHIGTLHGFPLSPISPLPDWGNFPGNGNSSHSVPIPRSDLSFPLELEDLNQPTPTDWDRLTSTTPKPHPHSTLQTLAPPVLVAKYPIKSWLAKDKAYLINRSVTSQLDNSLGTGSFASYCKLPLPSPPTNFPSHLSEKDPDPQQSLTVGHRFSIKKLVGSELCACCSQKFSEFLHTTYALQCDDCNFTCHKRCADLAPYNCDPTSPALKALNALFIQTKT